VNAVAALVPLSRGPELSCALCAAHLAADRRAQALRFRGLCTTNISSLPCRSFLIVTNAVDLLRLATRSTLLAAVTVLVFCFYVLSLCTRSIRVVPSVGRPLCSLNLVSPLPSSPFSCSASGLVLLLFPFVRYYQYRVLPALRPLLVSARRAGLAVGIDQQSPGFGTSPRSPLPGPRPLFLVIL